MSDKERRRERHELKRRKRRREERANAAATQQDPEAAKRAAWERRQRRRWVAYVVIAVGMIIGLSHVLEHANVFQILPNAAMQHLLLGYPTAGVLIVVGLALLPAERF